MLFSNLSKLWIGLLFPALHLWVKVPASTSQPSSPKPTLELLSRSSDFAVLLCRAPGGLKGVQFEMYRVREKVDWRDVPLGAGEVQFNVKISYSSPDTLFCCMYKTLEGTLSAFSSYLTLHQQKDADSSRTVPSNPDPPILSVEPSNRLIKRGDMLLFNCALPPPLPQYQVNSHSSPVSFMLLRGSSVDTSGLTSAVPQPHSSSLSRPEPQPGVFSVGPVTGAEQGQYTCLYQINRGRQLLNSTVSNMVQVTVADLLPTPSLVLQQESDVWHLLCGGSPSYPGAKFSLYLSDHAEAVASYQAKVTQHQAVFSVPVQDTAVALYQCEYSVLLGREWSKSERSLSLSVSQDSSYTPSQENVSVDWPMVVGSLSAVVLFLCSVALLTVVVHRKVKAAADAKKKREGAKFWTHIHGKDHVVDLTLQRSSFTSQDWPSGHSESASGSLWNPLSTFTTPIVPNY